MHLNDASRLQRARDAINAQIVERDQQFPDHSPVPPWTLVTKLLRYFLTLPPDQLQNARLHSDVFLGANFINYVFIDHDSPPAIQRLNDALGYSWLGEGVNPEWWASEPPVDALDQPLGYNIAGRVVNDVTVLLQRYVCNALRLGLADGHRVVEVGAGYGGLAHAVMAARRCQYAIVDFPETLIFSASFLLTHFPDARAYVYAPGDDPSRIDWPAFDFIFLPDYRSQWLRLMPSFDLAINTVSFPEMSRAALREYVELFADVLAGPLMSVNYHCDIRNDGRCVTDFLSERFSLSPTPDEIISGLDISLEEYGLLSFRPTILALPPRYDRGQLIGKTIRDVVFSGKCRRVVTTFTPEGASVAGRIV